MYRFTPLILAPVAILLAYVAATTLVVSSSPVCAEVTDFLLSARACVEGGACPSRGQHSSTGGLSHGAFWIRIVRWTLRAGLDLTALQIIFLASFFASAAILFVTARRFLSLETATIALALYLPLMFYGTNMPALLNTSLLPLGLAIYFAGSTRCIERGTVLPAVVASLGLALSISSNLAIIVMLPFHLAAVAVVAERPLPAVIVSAVSVIVPYALDSWDAFLDIVAFVSWPLAFAGVVGATLALWAAWRLRAAAASLSPPNRVLAFSQLSVSYSLVAGLLGHLVYGNPGPWYYAPAFIPLVVLAADAAKGIGTSRTLWFLGASLVGSLCLAQAPNAYPIGMVAILVGFSLASVVSIVSIARWRMAASHAPYTFGRSVACAVILLLLPIGASLPDATGLLGCSNAQDWTVYQSERIASALYDAGFRYPEIVGSIEGPATDTLMPLVAARDPGRTVPSEVLDTGWSLLALKAPQETVAKTKGVVAAVPFGAATVGLIVKQPSYVSRRHIRICQASSDGAAVSSCIESDPSEPVKHTAPYFPMPRLTSTESSTLFRRLPIRVSMRIVTPGSGETHIIRAIDAWPVPWSIHSVTGVRIEGGQLPGQEVRIADERPTSGTIEFEAQAPCFGGNVLGISWLPRFIEVTSANEHLLEPFRVSAEKLCSPLS